ncbi:MAG: curlin, partial [Alphaproteobacteria bacterium]
MFKKIIIAATLAASFGAVSVPAMANGIYINQYGWGHSAGGTQSGTGNTIGIFQDGWWNSSTNQQSGQGNVAASGQTGWNNQS